MATVLPIFTLVDIGEDDPFLRQAYYWIIKAKDSFTAGTLGNAVLIFSTEQKAVAQLTNVEGVECVAEVMFWEEIVAFFGKSSPEAAVDFSGDPKEKHLFLRLDGYFLAGKDEEECLAKA